MGSDPMWFAESFKLILVPILRGDNRLLSLSKSLTLPRFMTSDEQSFAVYTEGLGKSFGDVIALKGLNLRVPEKSTFGLLGPNGAGKTTTIKLLLGLLRPTSGRGVLLGQDIQKSNVEVRRRNGYLAQNPSYYTYMTAREILLFTLRFYYKGDKKILENRVQETLEMVELDKADRPIRGFSGGERQRLGIHRPRSTGRSS
jgi:ABC-2 type transport system ATP-binding protein